MNPTLLTWLQYLAIAVGAFFTGFLVVVHYPGFGHVDRNAVPMGFALAFITVLVTAIAVSEAGHRTTRITLTTCAIIWCTAALLFYLNR